MTKGSISLRGGQLIVAGEGATALDGSVLMSAFGQVKISGDYTFSNGVWQGATEDSSYTYEDTASAKAKANESLKSSGIAISDKDAFEGKQTGVITSDAGIMFNNLVANRGSKGVDIKVVGDSYSFENGITVGKGSELNVCVQERNGEKVLALRANGDVEATYGLPEGWKTNTGETSVTETFEKGQYITAAAILNKAGVESVTGTDVKWNGQDVSSVTLKIGHNYDGHYNNHEGGQYSNYDYCYFKVAGNEEDTVKDVNGKDIQKTNLVGEYNGQKFTILAGARVSLGSDGSIQVLSGDVYTEQMNVSQLPEAKEDGDKAPGASTNRSMA